jgi:Tol biopolymer transport system component
VILRQCGYTPSYRVAPYLVLALCLATLLIVGCGDDTTEPQTGSIQANFATDGSFTDEDGCLFSVDGADGQRLLNGESWVFGGLSTGTHTVTISDVASNCSVQGDRSRSVDVRANTTVFVRFTLDCSPPPTTTFATTSIGSAVDADGYALLLDGSNAGVIGANDSMTVNVAAGRYDVELTGVADNCTVIGENPVRAAIAGEGTTRIDFNVSCPPYYDHIVFNSSREGGTDIFVMASDGSRPTNLTPVHTLPINGEPYPSWSPDATEIAYAGDSGVNILNTADMSVRRISSPGPVGLCDWSPDGTRIVHDSFLDCPDNACIDIYVVNAGGMNPVNLTPGPDWGFDPAWSPDGSQIAFIREYEVWVMEADGSNPARLTDPRASLPTAYLWNPYEPAWSPDGSRIAFVGPGEQAATAIWVMDSDGSNLTRLTDDLLGYQAWRPSWSPDGSRIVYWAFYPDDGYCYQVSVMEADGSNPTNITNHPSCNTVPDWSPGQ